MNFFLPIFKMEIHMCPELGGMEIRKAERDDIPKIIALSVDCMEHSRSPYRQASLQELKAFREKDLQQLYSLFDQPRLGLFVAVDQESIIGHVMVLIGNFESLSNEQEGWIVDLSVKPQFRKSGIGKELSLRAESFVKQKGLRYIGLGVTTANTTAVKFYESMGYQEERKRMVKGL